MGPHLCFGTRFTARCFSWVGFEPYSHPENPPQEMHPLRLSLLDPEATGVELFEPHAHFPQIARDVPCRGQNRAGGNLILR